jgi:hypothetical protein
MYNDWQPKPKRAQDPRYPSEIERSFPRIAEKIVLMWGATDFPEFLNALMIDDRGDRSGFPREVIEEMLFLHAIHDARVGRQGAMDVTDKYRVFK